MRTGVLTVAAVALVACAAAPAGAGAAPAVIKRTGLVYGTGQVGAPTAGKARLRMDVYRPATAKGKRVPVVVFFHGGGFTTGKRSDIRDAPLINALARRGIAVAAIDYRLMKQKPVPSARVAKFAAALTKGSIFPAVASAADDTLTAIAYLERNAATLGIDAARLGLIGSSAGAITADHVAYALDDYGVSVPKIRFVASLWGGLLVGPLGPEGSPAANQLERGEPPLFSVHGTADTLVPVGLEDVLVARARRQRVPVTYYRVPGGTHGPVGTGFFRRKVKGADTAFDLMLDLAVRRLR